MFTVFDETEIDTLAEKRQYKKINVSLGEDRRLSSYVKVSRNSLISFKRIA